MVPITENGIRSYRDDQGTSERIDFRSQKDRKALTVAIPDDEKVGYVYNIKKEKRSKYYLDLSRKSEMYGIHYIICMYEI